MRMCVAFFYALTLIAVPAVVAAAPSAVLSVMKDELQRSFEELKKQPIPPYFMSYEIIETDSFGLMSSFGVIRNKSESRWRMAQVSVRVGDYKLDNTHPIRGGLPMSFFQRFSQAQVPIEEEEDALRMVLWYHTDKKYKQAVEQLTKVRTNVKVKVQEEDTSADFSREPPEKYIEDTVFFELDQDLWEQKLKRYSAPFAEDGEIYEANAMLSVTGETRWFVNSEGSEIRTSRQYFRLFIMAFTKADDGMELPRYESFFAFTPEGFPDDETILRRVDKMIEDLQALRKAPVVDPYTGPAILSGRASGVFFHEVFGHRIEGHRQKRQEEGQTFKKKVGEKLLPETFSIYFDPTIQKINSIELAGHYQYDNEGVKVQRVPVIEQGVLKNFLMSRSPIEGFTRSNGHGRSQAGFSPVARQSNLIVEISDPVSTEKLKEKLIEEIKAQGKPFGLLFEDIQGGFTVTGRGFPNAFNVMPIMVYRVFSDGREELVRGVDLIGTPLTAFGNISSGDDHVEVFNGICGAESGGVPVSAASPAALVSQIEVQKKSKSQEKPPILPMPSQER